MKPPKLGNVWCVSATLYDIHGKKIGCCMDTPNAIAKACMECKRIAMIQTAGKDRITLRGEYTDRMKNWNIAHSHLQLV